MNVDHSGFVIAFSLFRRGQPKESSTQTLARMASFSPPSTLITADSYFGSLAGVEALAAQNQHSLLSCRKDRPSDIFKSTLCPKVKEPGTCAHTFGEVAGTKFLAASSHNNKVVNILSTTFGPSQSTSPVKVLKSDDTEEQQHVVCEEVHVRTEAHEQYSRLMGFVDDCDRQILAGLPNHKFFCWSTAHMMWVMVMMVLVNAKRVWMSAKELGQMSAEQWATSVWRAFRVRARHYDSAIHVVRKDSLRRKRMCVLCFKYECNPNHRTVWECAICGPICRHCRASAERHERYATDESVRVT
jgi:hypothetical protein